MKMKRFLGIMSLVVLLGTLVACGSKEHKFVGKFTDQFNNKFELREDYTATIQFIGQEPIETTWFDGNNHDMPYATIKYNGDPAYYYLRDGLLYRHRENMLNGSLGIKIEWDD